MIVSVPAFAGRPADPNNPDDLLMPGKLLAAAEAAALPEPGLVGEGSMPADAPGAVPEPTPTESVVINLIARLVERGVLTKKDSSELIKQAEADAVKARSQAAPPQLMPPPAPAPELFPDAQVIPTTLPMDDEVRVTYIPEVVKAQLREEIKQEVMEQARNENWVAPKEIPEWVPRFRVAGDVRIRYEGDYLSAGNDNTGAFPNFNAINTGAPFDVSGTVFSPQHNVDQDRTRYRLRARLGAEVELGEGFTGGIRIATGENSSPVSTNQSLGASGGNFSKYAIWLDRAFLKYEVGGLPDKNLAISAGRFDNPFFSTTMIWDDDIGFDGAAIQAKYAVTKSLTPFITVGAFPVFNTDFNFSSNQPAKFESTDKYLYAGQLGATWKVTKDLNAKVAAAYYHFDKVEGVLSDPYTPLTAQDAGNTDNTRPSFAQKGNTYFPIRNIVPNALNNFGTSNQFQYFGLATPFHNLAFTGRIDYSRFEPVQLSLIGEYVRNLAFDKNAINLKAVNNRGPDNALGGVGPFDGGDTGWTLELRVGSPALAKRGDWGLGFGYRYLESDAVVDGFTDSDFGGGGTNLKGYTFSAAYALSSRVSLALKWLSADSIAGPPFKEDILLFDINGKF